MASDSEHFFLGIVDIFVIILPGVIAIGATAWLVNPAWSFTFLRDANTSQWLAILIVAFVVGHAVSGIGSAIEDKLSLDLKMTGEDKTERANTERALKELFSGEVHRNAVRARAAMLVHITSSAFSRELSRKDVDRRFFRNLAVIGLVSVILWIVIRWLEMPDRMPARVAIPALVLTTGFACWRYVTQDRKYTRDVFAYFLTLRGMGEITKKNAAGK